MMRSTRRRTLPRIVIYSTLSVTLLAGLGGCYESNATNPVPVPEARNDVVVEWSSHALDVFVAHDNYANGLNAVRVFSMVHAAQHDALNAIDARYEAYAFEGTAPDADPVAAAAGAAHHVLITLFPAQAEMLDDRLAASLEGALPGGPRGEGLALGVEAASAILALRSADGSAEAGLPEYVPGEGPGRYQFTAPFDFVFLPGWQQVTPFALDRADQFRSAPHPALTSESYAADFAEVLSLGRKDSGTRSADQRNFAMFWEEFSDMGWNRIARVVAVEQDLGLWETARLFALLNMAMADSYIAGWDSKFHYDLWRPVTAIGAAETDGNDATEADPTWESLLVTPPVQDYPSTHSALGNAAAAVLAAVFGDDTAFSFTSTSAAEGYESRSFTSFSQAADENAESRVMGGLHFRFACEAGQELGRRVGAWTVETLLRGL